MKNTEINNQTFYNSDCVIQDSVNYLTNFSSILLNNLETYNFDYSKINLIQHNIKKKIQKVYNYTQKTNNNDNYHTLFKKMIRNDNFEDEMQNNIDFFKFIISHPLFEDDIYPNHKDIYNKHIEKNMKDNSNYKVTGNSSIPLIESIENDSHESFEEEDDEFYAVGDVDIDIDDEDDLDMDDNDMDINDDDFSN